MNLLHKKKLNVANFNLTFGEKSSPMLDHFKDVIYPALKQSEDSEKEYFNFENITLTENRGVFILAGLIVKKTDLEVFSTYDEDGNLQNQNNRYPSAPYSYFMINLKNHRMALVKNQKGSPTIKEFEKATRNVLHNFVNEKNGETIDKEFKLPTPRLDIVPIPYSGKISEELGKVEKIEKLIMRFYPLNGDISTSDTFDHLRGVLDKTGSKSGNTQINSPKKIDEVGDILEETKGIIKPVLKVVYPNNVKRTLRAKDFSETMEISLDIEDSFIDNLDAISSKIFNHQEYIETSPENSMIYENNLYELRELNEKE